MRCLRRPQIADINADRSLRASGGCPAMSISFDGERRRVVERDLTGHSTKGADAGCVTRSRRTNSMEDSTAEVVLRRRPRPRHGARRGEPRTPGPRAVVIKPRRLISGLSSVRPQMPLPIHRSIRFVTTEGFENITEMNRTTRDARQLRQGRRSPHLLHRVAAAERVVPGPATPRLCRP